MMRIKTSELLGSTLDWSVAKCEELDFFFTTPDKFLCVWKVCPLTGEREASISYRPSTNWSQAGPIIEREKIELHPAGNEWSSDINRHYQQYGPTPLIAAMRCFVASKLGDWVEIPDELVNGKTG